MCPLSGFPRNLGTVIGEILFKSLTFQRKVCPNSGTPRNLGIIFDEILVKASTFQKIVCPNSCVSHNLGTYSQKFPDETIENI